MEQLNIHITNDLRNRLNSKDYKATEELAMIVAEETYSREPLTK